MASVKSRSLPLFHLFVNGSKRSFNRSTGSRAEAAGDDGLVANHPKERGADPSTIRRTLNRWPHSILTHFDLTMPPEAREQLRSFFSTGWEALWRSRFVS